MAGLLGYMAAGAAAGVGSALAEEGKSLREQRMRELEMQFRADESAKDRSLRQSEAEQDRAMRIGEGEKDRSFRSGEGDKDRSFRAGESATDRATRISEGEKDRGFRAGESEKDRAERRGLLSKVDYDNQGNAVGVTNTGEKKDLGYKTPMKSETMTPAQAEEAARKYATQERTDPNNPMSTIKTLDDAAYRQRLRDLGFANLAGAEKPASGNPAEPALAPQDPKQRKAGVVYKNPNGVKAEWTGSGWKRVD